MYLYWSVKSCNLVILFKAGVRMLRVSPIPIKKGEKVSEFSKDEEFDWYLIIITHNITISI